ncbi:MAG TPA: hypothetical protein VJ984_15380 [Xanthomonadales bacterium]|nr:hypothetical protein [Xanthomonadales bacterium]
MRFIELNVRTAIIAHGFDDENVEVEEAVNEPGYTRKLIAISRVQSVSEKYVLVNSIAGRQMYWEYEETMDEVVQKLTSAGLVA